MNWFDDIKNDADAQAHDERNRKTIPSEAHQEPVRQHNQRASDSEVAAAIAANEPDLVRAQFRRAIRKLEEHFEDSLDATGAQSGQNILARIHQITGERRRKYK